MSTRPGQFQFQFQFHCLRNGWLGNWKRRNDAQPVKVVENGSLAKVLEARIKAKADFPYGAFWARLQVRKKARPPGPDDGQALRL